MTKKQMILGSEERKDGKKVLHFDIDEADFKEMLSRPHDTCFLWFGGNSEFELVVCELHVTRLLKRK